MLHCIYILLSVCPSPIDGSMDCFQLLAIINDTMSIAGKILL